MSILSVPPPLRYRDFRVLWLATASTGIGFAGETVVMGWLLLERTDSPFIVGLGVALRSLPNFLLGIPGGALADRVDRRLVLRLVGLAMGATALLLGVLALTGQLTVWQILLFTFVGGGIRAVGQSARQTYAFDIVGGGQVVGGTSLMNLGQRVGTIAGSLGAGLALELWGAGAAYIAIALCHFLSSAVVLLARTRGQAAPVSRPPVWQGMKEYTFELKHNRDLAALVLLTAAVEMLGFSYQAVMPSLARDRLGLGAEGLGLINAFASCGGLAAILGISLWGELRHKGLTFLGVLLLFGAALVLLGNSGSLAMALLAIALVNGLAALSDLLSQSLVQSVVANDLRGRAMGSWVLAIGFGPIGHLQMGAVATTLGIAVALTGNGVVLIALACVTLIGIRRLRVL